MVSSIILLVLKASIALLVFGIGLTSTPRDAGFLLRHRRLFAQTLLSMHVAMPVLTIWLCRVFALNPAVEIALLALSISPVPPFLPSKVTKAGGDDAYTMSLVITTALLAIVIVPASLWALGGLFTLPTDTSTRMVIKVVAGTVLGPMAIGLGVGHFSPAAGRAGKRVQLFATILLAAAALPIIVRSWPAFRTLIGNGTLAAIVAFTLAGLGVGHLLGGPVPEHRTVLALATSSRHPAVAITIATADFPGNKLIVAAVLLALIVSAAASAPYVVSSQRRARTRLRPATPATPATPAPTTSGAESTSESGLHVGHSRSRES